MKQKKKAIALAALLIMAFLVFATVMLFYDKNTQVSPTPTAIPSLAPTPTPTPASKLAGLYSYIMSVSGSNYQILNSAGFVIESSTSSSIAFNYLLGSSGVASSGNSVYVESGAYAVSVTWNIYVNNVTVTFQSGAVLTAVNNFNSEVMWIYGHNVIISGVTINGNGLNQSPSAKRLLTGANFNDGVIFQGANDLIEYSTVYNVRTFGITTPYETACSNLGVVNCTVYDCGANGIMAGDPTVTDAYFINNVVYSCGDVGIDSYGTNTIITGNYVHDCGGGASPAPPMYGYNNGGWGIGIEDGAGSGNGSYVFIAGNTIVDCGQGIYVGGNYPTINYVLISGNTVTNQYDGGYGGSIVLDGSSYSIIEFNTINSAASLGINIGYGGGFPSSDDIGNTVYGNTYNKCPTHFINDGTGTITITPSIVAITVTSSPTGVGFVMANGMDGYGGLYSTSPYIFYDTVGNLVTLEATPPPGYTFISWSDGGAQSHTITVPSYDVTYTATY